MVKSSSDRDSGSPKNVKKTKSKKTLQPKQPHEVEQIEDDIPPGKTYYFNNAHVERILCVYLEGACIDVKLRDEIMGHAAELIRQIIRANNLHSIYPGREESSFMDLFQVAWMQIESVLYKYEALPHCLGCYNKMRPQDSLLAENFMFVEDLRKQMKECLYCDTKICRQTVYYRGRSKVFNMWSQIARTVVLAHIKKEKRDKTNYDSYQSHLMRKTQSKNFVICRFLEELKKTFKYNNDELCIILALERLYDKDDKAHEGLIAKLSAESGKSRVQVTGFLKQIRLRSFEFSDAPTGEREGMTKDRIAPNNDDE